MYFNIQPSSQCVCYTALSECTLLLSSLHIYRTLP
jgi:hypothetical protein